MVFITYKFFFGITGITVKGEKLRPFLFSVLRHMPHVPAIGPHFRFFPLKGAGEGDVKYNINNCAECAFQHSFLYWRGEKKGEPLLRFGYALIGGEKEGAACNVAIVLRWFDK